MGEGGADRGIRSGDHVTCLPGSQSEEALLSLHSQPAAMITERRAEFDLAGGLML